VVAETFDLTLLKPILPEIGLVVLAALLLIYDLAWRGTSKRILGWVTFAGMILIAMVSFIYALPGDQSQEIFGGMLRLDWAAFTFRLIFLFGAAATALFAMDSPKLGERGEFYLLLVIATLGMSLMAGASDLIMIYLAIETTTIPLYVQAGFFVRSEKSTEAGLKYLLYGAISSAVMLYGFSLIYGFTGGNTNIYTIAKAVSDGQLSPILSIGLFMLVLVGLAFKMTIVPMQFWAPDVYEGAPTPVAGFLSTASKAAGFVVMMRLIVNVFNASIADWQIILAVLATLTMVLGNVLALTQKNIKRLLAYSSIAQAGYILIGIASASALGFAGAVYYLIAYLVTNLAAFGVVAVVGKASGSDELSAYNGLSRRAPGLALVLLVALLSLGGIPPFGGFAGKLFIFASAVGIKLYWLAFVGILNSIIGLYYYLIVLKIVYLHPSPEGAPTESLTAPWAIALGLCVMGILALGIYLPLLETSYKAIMALF
jgi:NADH-quinone oxidoreductase subunit N